MQMADRNRQSIGGIGRLWNLRQIQQSRNHVLHLLLLRPAVANHSGFNGKWRVLSDFESRRRRGQHGDSAFLSQLKA